MDVYGNINFKGVDSSTFGLLINYDNIDVKPVKRSSVLNVIGKDGSIVSSDKHNAYELILECRLKGDIYERRKQGRLISAWLQGIGDLIIGIEQDVKYQAQALESVNTTPIYVLEDFFISFLVQPIRKSTLEERFKWGTAHIYWGMAHFTWGATQYLYEDITSGDTIEADNIGNYEALPTLVISGQATTLEITDDNGVTFTFNNLNGTIYVNSEDFLVYSGTVTKVNEIQDSNGEFITLNVGVNTIDIVGTGFVGLDIEFQNVSAFI